MSNFRLQTSVRKILAAIFWLATALGAGMSAVRLGTQVRSTVLPVVFWLAAIALLAPFIAAGALFGRASLGALVGMSIWLGVYAILAMLEFSAR